MMRSEVVECVDRFTYLGSLISPCGLVCDEISARLQKARLAFANLRHLWHRRDIRLSTKGRVYCAAVRPVLLYGKNVNIESCGEIQYHKLGNEILQIGISSNSDIYNSLKSLTWLAENVETPLTVPVHRRRGRPPRHPRIPSSISQSVYSAKSCEKTFLT
ncbi:unnamed protein product [Schistosoma margrebowiei]|uniref:Uncharacterized protein n=1 Tax=Schistosoma margrebowiei TaxID=48269 RepID=A0A183MC50_9TREM|nr:unnamed protein product [Schistosoma margrebowiei]